MSSGRKDEILRLRVRHSAPWTPASRIALEHCLGNLDVRPPALPPSAVLIIRRLSGLPAVDLQRRSERSLEREARRRVEDLCRSAARPVAGESARHAEAVLFSDEGEMLACLLREIARGTAREHWWSRVTLDRLRLPNERPLALLAHRPRYVPSVIAQLAEWGEAIALVRAAEPREIAECFHALVAEHALGAELITALSHAAQGASSHPGQDLPAESSSAGGPVGGTPEHGAAVLWTRPPWRQQFPEARSGVVSAIQELFLGTALSAHNEPARTRSSLFARQAALWAASPARQESRVRDREAKSGNRAETAGVPEPDRLRQQGAAKLDNGPEHGAPPIPDAPGRDEFQEKAAPLGHHSAPASGGSAAGGAPVAPNGNAPSPHENSASLGRAEAPAARAGGECFETELGGLLYLVNVLEKLDLPDCFEDTWHLASQLGPWALLELIGRALLEGSPDDCASDPFWRALADLDGRDGGLPGASFRGQDTYRIPTAWYAGEPVVQEFQGDRVRLWSPADFVVYDGPGDARMPAVDTARQRLFSLPGLERAGLNPALLQWLCCAMTFIRFRISEALQLDDGPAVVRALLRTRGRVFLTRTHVDLVAGLESVSVRVRASGLDFDPGWSPRMGRIILFHFGTHGDPNA